MNGAHVLLFCALGLNTMVTAASSEDTNTGPVTGTDTGDSESAKQIGNITCDVNGTIYVHVNSGSWIQHISTQCGHSSNVTGTSPDFTITGCAKDNVVNITMSAQPILKSNTITTGETIGVTCTDLSGPVTLEVNYGLTGKLGAYATLPPIRNTIQLVMSLKQQSNKHEVHTVVIGVEYDLVISDAGNHPMHVDSCDVANNAKFNNTVSIYSKGIPSANTNVLDQFANGTGSVTTTLHGFRLIGSTTVYLRCTVEVSPLPTSSPTTSGTRRRKGRKHVSTQHEAVLSFQVRDKTVRASVNRGSDTAAVNNMLTFLVLFVTVFWRSNWHL